MSLEQAIEILKKAADAALLNAQDRRFVEQAHQTLVAAAQKAGEATKTQKP